MHDFHVGQLVLCVDDVPLHEDEVAMGAEVPGEGLLLNSIYRIVMLTNSGILGCFLDEDENATEAGVVPWALRRFRPLRDEALDVFRAMLEPTQHEQKIAAAVRELMK